MVMALSIYSNNVKGLRGALKRRQLFTFCSDLGNKFICLQETHSDPTCENEWKADWGGNIIFSHGTSNSLGVAILYKGNEKLDSAFTDKSGRYAGIIITVESKRLAIVTVYAPNSESEQISFYNTIMKFLGDLVYDDLVLCGDFNLCMDIKLDKKGGNVHIKRSIQSLKNILLEFNLVDTWRKRNPQAKQYTWHQKNPEVHCRLDYFFLTKSIDSQVTLADIIYVPYTDHRGIQIAFKLKTKQRGPSFWKHNNSLLSNKTYREQMKEVINQAWETAEDLDDLRVGYDFMKFKIRQFSIEFSKKLARDRRKREKEMQDKIKQLEQKSNIRELSQEELEALEVYKLNLDDIYKYKVRGEVLRSRLEQIEQDEKSTAYFFRCSKANYEKKTIDQLEINGMLTNDVAKISE